MSKKVLIITGGSGYILNSYDFNKYKDKFDIYYIKNKKKIKTDISYEKKELEILFSKINNISYEDILLISFGSHLGGNDPGLYFKSLTNLKKIIYYLKKINKNIYIYHASSFSIFNPNKNCSLFSFLNNEKIDFRGAYSFSKKEQNKIISNFTIKNIKVKSNIVHLGHVYDEKNKLIDLFKAKSVKVLNFVFSILYSPFKLINPTSLDVIHNDLTMFIKNHEKNQKRINEYPLTDNNKEISLFNIFLKEKLIFISPIPIIVCTFSPIMINLLPKHSNLSYLLKKYLQMNNSIKL